MSIEAMKQALEALETVTKEMLTCRDELAERGGRPVENGARQWLWDSSFDAYTNHAMPAAEALRQAIATEESSATQEPVSWRNAAIRVGEDLCSVGPFGYYDMTAEQWLTWALSVVTVHPQPKAEQEPVACVVPHGATMRLEWASVDAAHNAKIGPLYTTPPHRTWAGLTLDERAACYEASRGNLSKFASQIEAKLKEKNA